MLPSTRSLFFVLYKAVTDLYPECRLQIDSNVSNGFYCHLSHVKTFDADAIKRRMHEIIDAKLPFVRHELPKAQAIDLFRTHGQETKALLLETTGKGNVEYFTLENTPNSFYGEMLKNTDEIGIFDILPYDAGLLLRLPSPEDKNKLLPFVPQPKMLSVFREYHRWQNIMGLSTVGEMNAVTKEGRTSEMIYVSEAMQDKKIIKIADHIAQNKLIKVVLIAGPSSSGKTTFSKRLSIQLMANGLKPEAISLDNYFVDREQTPLDEFGQYDFESIYAMKIDLLNEHLMALLNGEEIEMPFFNFKTGKSEKSGKMLKLQPETVLILEGIHALNPLFTEQIPAERKYRVFASALTSILLDDHNYIATTDNRLIRRMVRDYKYRNFSAQQTLKGWKSVRRGEEKWLVPFQEGADELVNTALLFELACLRDQAIPLLDSVPADCEERAEADRLTRLLKYLKPISLKALPPTSLLREFVGGSSFSY